MSEYTQNQSESAETLESLFAPSVRKLTIGLGLSTALVAFEGLSVVAALPELGRDLTSTETVRLLPLVMTVYLLASGIAIAVSGPLADGLGPRRVYRAGLLLFALASLGCGFSSNLWQLIPLRLLQGAAGGMLIACSGASVGLGYPLLLRARAYALAATVWGVVGVGGPAIAAALLTVLSWRWIFWANVPLALFALVVAWNAIPGPAKGASLHRFDRLGIVLLIALVTSAVAGLSEVSSTALVCLFGTVIFAVLFHRHSASLESGPKPPVVRRRHYAEMPFSGLGLTAALAVGASIGVENYLPLYLREARATGVGLAAWSVLFLTVGWTTAANTVSRIYHRVSEARCAQLGTASLPISILMATVVIWQGWALGWLFLAYFLMGLGVGATTNACLTLTQAAAVETEVGRATSAHQFLRNMALTYGTASMGTLVLVFSPTLGLGDQRSAELLTNGYLLAHLAAFVLALLATVQATAVVRYHSTS